MQPAYPLKIFKVIKHGYWENPLFKNDFLYFPLKNGDFPVFISFPCDCLPNVNFSHRDHNSENYRLGKSIAIVPREIFRNKTGESAACAEMDCPGRRSCFQHHLCKLDFSFFSQNPAQQKRNDQKSRVHSHWNLLAA